MVSSYLASLLLGAPAPLDPGDASGMNLMNLATAEWIPEALEATAPELYRRLPPIVASHAILGRLSPYWQARYRLPWAQVVAWSGDNPCSLVGTGLVREGRLAISLGTSDTVFGLMRAPRVDPSGTGHVFAAPTGDFMGLTCFSNGSLAREAVRDAFDLDWRGFSAALDQTPPGNRGALMLPWFVPEIPPAVARPGVERRRLDPSDGPASVRAVVEGQMMSMANHAGWMGVDVDAIYATGGGSANAEILQVMADVFGADVYRFASTNTACLGAALRAFQADRCAAGDPVDWDDVVRGLAEPDAASCIRPRREFAGTYRTLRREYQEFETAALG
jgi:xylulokinase